jgi:hypothetical protein
MPLDANVPRRRPLAEASSFISHPRASAPRRSGLRGGPQATGKLWITTVIPRTRGWQSRNFTGRPLNTGLALEHAGDPSPVWPGGLWGEVKEEVSAARRMPGDIHPKGLQVAPGPSGCEEPRDQMRCMPPAPIGRRHLLALLTWKAEADGFPARSGRRAQTLKRKCSTSPSCTRYSLPSRRRRPASRAPDSPRYLMKSS